jgi:hypothetical protein
MPPFWRKWQVLTSLKAGERQVQVAMKYKIIVH